jgi:hypothetical protein
MTRLLSKSTRNQQGQAASDAPSAGKDLHDSVLSVISGRFPDCEVSEVGRAARPDLVLRIGDKIAAVEVKTGDPELPLPSSTIAQMHLLTDSVKDGFGGKAVTPVLVTNYLISESDELELKDAGIQVIHFEPQKSLESFGDVFAKTLTSNLF